RTPLPAPNWYWLADQLRHREWEGCTFWDLIQPSFMFIVGAAMPFAFALRESQGHSWGRQLFHAVKRAGLLLLLGLFLDYYQRGVRRDLATLADIWEPVPLIRVLQQIAIGYLIAFPFLRLGPRIQAAMVVFLLAGHTAAF